MYEVRADNNPQAMPRGTSTISRHATRADAEQAISSEWRKFRRSPSYTDGCWLPRLIVEVDQDGNDMRLVRL